MHVLTNYTKIHFQLLFSQPLMAQTAIGWRLTPYILHIAYPENLLKFSKTPFEINKPTYAIVFVYLNCFLIASIDAQTEQIVSFYAVVLT